MDHNEFYLTDTGKIVIVTSPYNYTFDTSLNPHWQHYKPLYNKNTNTYILCVDTYYFSYDSLWKNKFIYFDFVTLTSQNMKMINILKKYGLIDSKKHSSILVNFINPEICYWTLHEIVQMFDQYKLNPITCQDCQLNTPGFLFQICEDCLNNKRR